MKYATMNALIEHAEKVIASYPVEPVKDWPMPGYKWTRAWLLARVADASTDDLESIVRYGMAEPHLMATDRRNNVALAAWELNRRAHGAAA